MTKRSTKRVAKKAAKRTRRQGKAPTRKRPTVRKSGAMRLKGIGVGKVIPTPLFLEPEKDASKKAHAEWDRYGHVTVLVRQRKRRKNKILAIQIEMLSVQLDKINATPTDSEEQAAAVAEYDRILEATDLMFGAFMLEEVTKRGKDLGPVLEGVTGLDYEDEGGEIQLEGLSGAELLEYVEDLDLISAFGQACFRGQAPTRSQTNLSEA